MSASEHIMEKEYEEDRRTIGELDVDLEKTTFPHCFLFSWHAAFPRLHVKCALRVLDGFGEEAKRMLFAPLLAIAPWFRNKHIFVKSMVVWLTAPLADGSGRETWLWGEF